MVQGGGITTGGRFRLACTRLIRHQRLLVTLHGSPVVAQLIQQACQLLYHVQLRSVLAQRAVGDEGSVLGDQFGAAALVCGRGRGRAAALARLPTVSPAECRRLCGHRCMVVRVQGDAGAS